MNSPPNRRIRKSIAPRAYNRIAKRYDRLMRRYLEPSYDLMLKHIDARPGQSVLDIGCGTGELLLRLGRRFGGSISLAGTEPSEGMLAIAQEKLKAAGVEARLLQGFVQDHPPEEVGTHDWVVSSNVVHYLPDPAAEVALWSERVRPGGHMVTLTVDGGRWQSRLLSVVAAILLPGWHTIVPLETLEAWHRTAGFEVVSSERKPLTFWLGAIVVVAKRP